MIFDKNEIQIVPVGQPFLYAYIYGVPGLPDPMHRIAYLKVHRKYHLLHPLQSIQLSCKAYCPNGAWTNLDQMSPLEIVISPKFFHLP